MSPNVTGSLNNTRSESVIVPIASTRINVRADWEASVWAEKVRRRLTEITGLSRGWDGYRAPPVAFDTAMFAFSALTKLCAAGTPVPQIVPGTEGDLQAEWHTDYGSIELHFREPNHVHAWMEDVSGNSVERVLTSDFAPVLPWIRLISEAPGAAVAAAG